MLLKRLNSIQVSMLVYGFYVWKTSKQKNIFRSWVITVNCQNFQFSTADKRTDDLTDTKFRNAALRREKRGKVKRIKEKWIRERDNCYRLFNIKVINLILITLVSLKPLQNASLLFYHMSWFAVHSRSLNRLNIQQTHKQTKTRLQQI